MNMTVERTHYLSADKVDGAIGGADVTRPTAGADGMAIRRANGWADGWADSHADGRAQG